MTSAGGQAIVIDAGSGVVKAGLSGEDEPSSIFPSIVGQTQQQTMVGLHNQFSCFVGNETNTKRGIMRLMYPIQHGVVEDWDQMEQLLHHAFHNELRVTPSDHPVLLSESPSNPKLHREKTIQMMFETFQVPKVYLGNTAALSLYASGRTTGIVFDSGDGVSHVVPVADGHTLRHATEKMGICGRDLTDFMVRKINEKGVHTFATTFERELVREMKEKYAYVSLDYEEDLLTGKNSEEDFQVEHELPDGSMITLGSERFKSTEPFFKPSLMNGSFPAVHEQIHQCILKCDVGIRKELYHNILLSGGNTMFSGLAERLHKEITALNVIDGPFKIINPVDRNHSAWIGGSVIASLSTFPDLCITEDEYDEIGPMIVHKKCFQ